MATYRKTNALDAATAAYIAGLVDGEGTVTLTRTHRGENRRLVVCISNNELAILQYVHRAVGAGRITTKRTYAPHHAQSYAYQISSRQALALLYQVFPYMRSYKAIRAGMALADYERVTPRNGRYSDELRRARAAFENRLLATKP